MTVLSFMDCESGCVSACATDKGTSDLFVSVVGKGMEFCGRKRVVLRTDSERAISALSTAVCQARTEETILEECTEVLVYQYGCTRGCESSGRADQEDTSTTGTGAEGRDQHHGSNRSMGRSTRLWVTELVQSHARRLHSPPGHERMAIRRRSGRAGGAGPLEGVRPIAPEVRRSLACWNMARQSGEVG